MVTSSSGMLVINCLLWIVVEVSCSFVHPLSLCHLLSPSSPALHRGCGFLYQWLENVGFLSSLGTNGGTRRESVHSHMHVHSCACVRVRVCVHVCVCLCVCVSHACTHARMHARTNDICMHGYVHTHAHTHTHTYTHIAYRVLPELCSALYISSLEAKEILRRSRTLE